MKKLFVFFALLFAVVGLTGCSVAGKTYVYDSFDYELSEDLTTIEKGIAEGLITTAKKGYEILEFTFNEDGTNASGAKWTKEGSTIKVDGLVDYELKLKGSKLVIEVEENNYSYVVTFVVKK